jgi:hypothetical protein
MSHRLAVVGEASNPARGVAPNGAARLAALMVTAGLTLTLATAVPAAPVMAQISDAWLEATPVEGIGVPRSARLEALGGLRVSIEDDESRVELFDFTDNPAGLLADRDTSSVEQFSDYGDFSDGLYGLDHSVVQRQNVVRAALRRSHTWVVGLDASYGDLKASRHDLYPSPDGSRFIRDFDMPIVSVLTPQSGDRTFGAQIGAPRGRLTYARSFWSRLTMGVRTSYVHESEDRKVVTTYPLDHTSRSASITGGALYDLDVLGGGITAGTFASYSSDKVVGRSETALNHDRYDWWRPQVLYGGQLAVRAGWVRGIVDGRHRSFNGEEVASINWAPFFFLNPLPSQNQTANIFKTKWSAFLSGLRHNEASTRWLADLPGTHTHVGVAYRYYREFEWIRVNPEVLSAAHNLDVRRLGYEAMGGISVDLPDGQGLLAAEVHSGRNHRLDFTGQLPEIITEELSYHCGAEYRARPWLPLRVGLVLLRENPDRRSGLAPVKGIQVSGGAGYFWKWLATRFDVAWAHQHLHFSPGDPSQEISFGDRVTVNARYLF